MSNSEGDTITRYRLLDRQVIKNGSKIRNVGAHIMFITTFLTQSCIPFCASLRWSFYGCLMRMSPHFMCCVVTYRWDVFFLGNCECRNSARLFSGLCRVEKAW